MRIIYILLIFSRLTVTEKDPYETDFCQHGCPGYQNICCQYKGTKFSQSCGDNPEILELKPNEIKMIVKAHNQVRNDVAGGNSPREDLVGIEASNMRILSYSKELAHSAGCWARQCGTSLSRCRATQKGYVGETICWDSPLKMKEAIAQAITFLILTCPGNHIQNFPVIDKGMIDNYRTQTEGDIERGEEGIQVIWAETKFIGCTRVAFQHSNPLYRVILFVCHFFPIGNIEGKPIFLRGKPTTQCPNRTTANKHYKNLCGVERSLDEDFWIGALNDQGNTNDLNLFLALLLFLSRYYFAL